MSQAYELLVTEVDRVVNSPYPTQLKVGLHCSTTFAILGFRSTETNDHRTYTRLHAKNAQMQTYWNGQRRETARSTR
jgi:hypothetical protein